MRHYKPPLFIYVLHTTATMNGKASRRLYVTAIP